MGFFFLFTCTTEATLNKTDNLDKETGKGLSLFSADNLKTSS